RILVLEDTKVTGGVQGRLINISEEGVCISSSEVLQKKSYSLSVTLSGEKVSFPIKIMWCELDNEKKQFLCGARIEKIKKSDLAIIRKYMVTKQFEYVAKNVSDKDKRKEILVFAKEVRDYLINLINLRKSLQKIDVCESEIQKKVTNLSHEIVQKGEDLRKKISDEKLILRIKDVFRALVSAWVFKSKIMYRGLSKPKGYPGDYETLELIYDNMPVSLKNYDLGYYFDISFLNNPYANAVRERKNKLREIIEILFKEKSDPINILNLACGGCKEIRDICSEDRKKITKKEVFFNCLDWDKDALDFSKEQLKNAPKNFHISFLEENILSFIRKTDFFEKRGKQDLIYSIGLADYFSDRILKTMIKSSFNGLKTGGHFIIAHKDKDLSFSHIPPEWFCDWTFCQRNEQDLLEIIESLKMKNVRVEKDRDKTGDVFFYILTKE
ncbi:MAG: class I SAM-dependent methyltransferase, partial [Candidatus Omnitrophota bacterium]